MRTTGIEQESIVEKLYPSLKSNDSALFGEIITPIRGRIVRLAQQRLQREDVEDIVQQTLITFWEKRSAVRGPEHIMPFIFQILRNKIGDSYRREKVLRETFSSKAEPIESLHNPASGNPVHLLEEKELTVILKEAISICAAENRTWGRVLQLLKEEQPREVIRKELGNIPMATVYSRIFRARQRLLRILKDEFGVEI